MRALTTELNNKTINLILGGGVGSRLYPLTKTRSKPAVPIAGKYRLIDIPISNCLNSGLQHIYVLTQFNSASLNKHITHSYRFDMFSNGYVDILAAEQTRESGDWFQGTADAVRQSWPNTRHRDAEYVIILSGDQLYQMDLQELLTSHIENKAEITIATIPVVAEDATAFGIMKVADDQKISSFVEKPPASELPKWKSAVAKEYTDQGKYYVASMGIYIFSKTVLEELLLDKYRDMTDFGKEIIPAAIVAKRDVYSYSYGGYWNDIGDIRNFYEANIALTKPSPDFNLFDKHFGIYTRSRQLPPSKIFGTILREAFVAEGCLIYAELIQNTIVGLRSRIGEGTMVIDTYLMGNDRFQFTVDMKPEEISMGIGKNCYIRNAIIEKHVFIGDNVTIVGDESLDDTETEHYSIRKGIVIVHKRAKIANGTHIGNPRDELKTS